MCLRKFAYGCVSLVLLVWMGYMLFNGFFGEPSLHPGDVVDSYQRVEVYYNGGKSKTHGRHLAADGYNFGIKWQNVEFVKRFYYENFEHRMPDTYGYAKDYFNPKIADGQLNTQRNLLQFKNPSSSAPIPGDIIIFGKKMNNRYGHAAIITKVLGQELEIIQQNTGLGGKSRETLSLTQSDGLWKVDDKNVLGWLRKP